MEVLKVNGYPYQGNAPFYKTSEKTPVYNCIAWALNETERWYEPPDGGPRIYYWPEGLPEAICKEAYLKLFESKGYVICENGELEKGYEKVVLYYHPYLPRRPHASRQCADGTWTSKLGQDEDVNHTLETLRDGLYGDVQYYMRRRLPPRGLVEVLGACFAWILHKCVGRKMK